MLPIYTFPAIRFASTRSIAVCCLFVACCTAAIAQYERIPLHVNAISGRVVDHHGQPLIGASVFYHGGCIGTVTDLDGRFTLVIPRYSEFELPTLHVSLTCCKYKEVKLKHRHLALDRVLDNKVPLRESIVLKQSFFHCGRSNTLVKVIGRLFRRLFAARTVAKEVTDPPAWNTPADEAKQEIPVTTQLPVSAMTLHPNPASDRVQVSYASTLAQTAQIWLVDATGQRHWQDEWQLQATENTRSLTLAILGLPVGQYYILLRLPDGMTERQGILLIN